MFPPYFTESPRSMCSAAEESWNLLFLNKCCKANLHNGRFDEAKANVYGFPGIFLLFLQRHSLTNNEKNTKCFLLRLSLMASSLLLTKQWRNHNTGHSSEHCFSVHFVFFIFSARLLWATKECWRRSWSGMHVSEILIHELLPRFDYFLLWGNACTSLKVKTEASASEL